MLRLKVFILASFVALQLWSCQNQENNSKENIESTDKKKKVVSNSDLEMYTPSELADLMLNMYSTNKSWKNQIEKGIVPTEIPKDYQHIHTLESVNDKAKSEFFNTMASSLLQSTTKVTESNTNNVKSNYNDMVNVCISCHQQICQGPIPKIKKLYIP